MTVWNAEEWKAAWNEARCERDEAQAEVERLRDHFRSCEKRYQEQVERAEAALAAEREQSERLREALEIIAGKRQCLDNLMSNAEVARAALAPEVK